MGDWNIVGDCNAEVTVVADELVADAMDDGLPETAELFEGNTDSDDKDFVLTRGESVTTVPGTDVVVLEVREEDVEDPVDVVAATPATVGLGDGGIPGVVKVPAAVVSA